jgi:hypothetical protein
MAGAPARSYPAGDARCRQRRSPLACELLVPTPSVFRREYSQLREIIEQSSQMIGGNGTVRRQTGACLLLDHRTGEGFAAVEKPRVSHSVGGGSSPSLDTLRPLACLGAEGPHRRRRMLVLRLGPSSLATCPAHVAKLPQKVCVCNSLPAKGKTVFNLVS